MATLDFLKRMLGTPSAEAAPQGSAAARETNSTDRRLTGREQGEIGLKVLVVDDSQTIVNVLTRMLEQNHYQVMSAGDAEKGLELAKVHN